MTTQIKSKGKGRLKNKRKSKLKSNCRFLHCAFAQARTLRSE